MTSRLARWALLPLLMLTLSTAARAQVEMELRVTAPTVEVGQPFEVRLSAMSEQGSPENPRLSSPAGVTVRGPSVGTSVQVGFSNGRMSKKTGVSATWVLSAARTGKLTVGPAAVDLDGKVYQSRPAVVEVVARGTLPPSRAGRRRAPFGNFPDPFDFDPFGGMPGMPDLDDFFQDEPPPSDYPAELATQAALDPLAFLRATLSSTRVYLGQQVTLQVFAYGARGPFQEISAKEPARTDFFSHSLIDGTTSTRLHRMPIGEDVWHAAKIREVVLFPLRTGELTVGAMEFGFGGGRYGNRPGVVRQSQPLTVTVAEPPLEGRPAGYQLGDVGRFSLRAEVEPRDIEAGGSVSAVITLSGTGNLPSELRVPTRSGVDFLTPSVRHTPRVQRGLYGGSKVFTYVIRVSEPGSVDLGEVRLPYFDPDLQRYEVASVQLGRVNVRPSATQATANDTPATPSGLSQLLQSLSVRNSLSMSLANAPPLTDRLWSWLLLLAAPLAVLLLQALLALSRRLARWSRARRDAPTAQVAQHLAQARQQLKQGATADAASAIERALYVAIATRFGINARGMLRGDLTARLATELPPERCQQLAECLETCDGVRFAPASNATVEQLLEHASELCSSFLRAAPRARGGPAAAMASVVLALCLVPSPAYATDDSNDALFARAVKALQAGAHQEAIDVLELLSDRGFHNPAVSFNRALAYLGRANGPQQENGDLGQAAAGFEEARLLDRDQTDATEALERLRMEIAREHTRAGRSPLSARPSLGRAIVALLHENTWFMLALIGSLSLAAGLALRRWATAAPLQIAALIALGLGLPLLLIGSSLAHSARTHRLNSKPAVVITTSARLLDAAGTPVAAGSLGTAEVSEGSRVDVLEIKGMLARIDWGASDGWVKSAQLRRLATF